MIWFAMVFMGLGLGSMFLGRKQVFLALDSKHWQSTEGQIVFSEAVEDSCGSIPVPFRAKVRYSYCVLGRDYVGSNITHAEIGEGEEDAQKRLEPYPLGQKVTVFYSPNQPQESVLVPGFNWVSIALPASGLLFFVIGLMIPLLQQ